MTPEGWYRYPIFDGKVADMIGAKMGEVDAKVNEEVLYNGDSLKGYWHKEYISPDTAEVLATYKDDSAAVTLNRYNSGNVLYFTTHFGNEIIHGKGSLTKVLDDTLEKLHISPDTMVDFEGKQDKEVDCHLLETDDKAMLIITKYFNKNQREIIGNGIDVSFKVKLNASKLVNYSTGDEIKFVQQNEYISFNMTIDHNEFYVIEVTK